MEDRAHGLAQARAERLLTRRTPSVASGLSAGTEHPLRRNRRYAEYVMFILVLQWLIQFC